MEQIHRKNQNPCFLHGAQSVLDSDRKAVRRYLVFIPTLALRFLLAFAVIPALAGERSAKSGETSIAAESRVRFAGARSSSYGIRPFPSGEGWVKALKTMGDYFPGSTPVGIWIVGRLHGASTGISLEFPRPTDGKDYGPLVNFSDFDKHEPYLNQFDKDGIKVFLQIEPGFGDVGNCIDLVLKQYQRHPSVIGFGVDVEWFQNARNGRSNAIATDAVVKAWDAKVKSFNMKYRLFVKHFRIDNLPPTYRGDVVFVDDSQQVSSLESFLAEYKDFADFFYPNTVMYQIGYRSDRVWWDTLAIPIPKTLGEKLAAQTRQDCGIVWVDFTLRDVLPTE
jgi:hypothetical protein